LNEHFRCAPEIISFSNTNFYNEELVSMRLPTKSERISPSIMEVRVPNGKKIGKSNKEEADAIIKHVAEITSKSLKDYPRSIGIISLMGSEQSQVIRSGLLEAIGPHEVARHDILVGDPPTFQGTERDSKCINAQIQYFIRKAQVVLLFNSP
jgi:superfamily I DNA and/or RNA helicase